MALTQSLSEPVASLPPSWNAHRSALEALGLRVDAVDCYGFGGGLGFRYYSGPAPLLLGFGSLDPTWDLTISAGAWPDRKHSTDRRGAVAEMRDHLERERTPVIVPLRPLGDEDLEIEPETPTLHGRTFVSVRVLSDDRVQYSCGDSSDHCEVAASDWVERLIGEARRWAVVVGNGHFTDIPSRVRASLRRIVHRFATGWRGRLGGLSALDAFCSELCVSPARGLDYRATLRASEQLAGGMGRGLFASFLDRHQAWLPSSHPELATHFRGLDARWRAIELVLAKGERPSPLALKEVMTEEAVGLERLQAMVNAWRPT